MPRIPVTPTTPQNPLVEQQNSINSDMWAKSSAVTVKTQFDQQFEKIASLTQDTSQLTPNVLKAFDDHATQYLDKAPDQQARDTLKSELDGYRAGLSAQSMGFEAQKNIYNRRLNAVNIVENNKIRVATNPNLISEAFNDIEKASVNFDENTRADYIAKAKKDVAYSAMQKRIQQDPTSAFNDVDNLIGVLNPNDIASLKNESLIAQNKKTNEQDKLLSDAKHTVNSLTASLESGSSIGIDSILNAETIIKKTGDPKEIRKFEAKKAVLDQQRYIQTLTPSQARSYVDGLKSGTMAQPSENVVSFIDTVRNNPEFQGKSDFEIINKVSSDPEFYNVEEDTVMDMQDHIETINGLDSIEKGQASIEKLATSSPLEYASKMGKVNLSPIDVDDTLSMSQRLKDAKFAQSVTGSKLQLLTDDEVVSVSKKLNKMDENGIINLADNIKNSFGNNSDDFLVQLNETNPVEAHAIAISHKSDDGRKTARNILSGYMMLKKDPSIRERMFPKRVNDMELGKVVGRALDNNGSLSTIQSTADAYYVNEVSKSGKTEFDKELYRKAIHKAVGGTDDPSTGIQRINGVHTVLPPTITSDEFEMFTSMLPPAIADYGTFSHLGGNRYAIDINGTHIGEVELTAEDIRKELNG